MSTISFFTFGTFDFMRSTAALISISSGNDQYVEIKLDPYKIIISTPDNTMQVFETYIVEQGYTILEDEQLGALINVYREGKDEIIAISVNNYYSI